MYTQRFIYKCLHILAQQQQWWFIRDGKCDSSSAYGKEMGYTIESCGHRCLSDKRCKTFSVKHDKTKYCLLIPGHCPTSVNNNGPWKSYSIGRVLFHILKCHINSHNKVITQVIIFIYPYYE